MKLLLGREDREPGGEVGQPAPSSLHFSLQAEEEELAELSSRSATSM